VFEEKSLALELEKEGLLEIKAKNELTIAEL